MVSPPTLLRFISEFVILPTRIVIFLVCAVLGTQRLALALTLPANPAGETLSPGLAAFLALQPNWSTSAAVETAFGYKDNLLLSHTGEEQSAFARGGIEFLLLRVPKGQVDYSFFVQADGTRYRSGRTVDDESKAWAQTEVGYRTGEAWKFSLPITGYHYDQVFDVSDTDVERLVAELKVSGLMVGPAVRWAFHPAWWFEAQAVGERKRYADRVNDGRVGETAARLGWKRGERFEARLAGSERWRDFDLRSQYSSAGRELAGLPLKIRETEGELRFDVRWDLAGRWQTVTRTNVLRYRDNGSGYFSYREKKISHELEWNSENWRIRLGGTARRIDFEVQTVGFGLEPPPRVKDEFDAELRLERKLARRWTGLAGYTWERSRSNDTVASYIVNEGWLGLRWSWER